MKQSCCELWNQELKGHQIERVQFYRCRARYPRLHGKNAIRGYHGFGGEIEVAKLTTKDGITGWGQLSRGMDEAKRNTELLLKRPLTELFDSGTGILDEKLLAFDIPLHDLAGKILGIPVCRMINPDSVLRAPVYDGAIYMNDIIPEDAPFGVDRVIQVSVADVRLGHTILKVKIGRGHRWMEHGEGMARDIEIVRRIHETLPGIAIMVDANDGYTLEDAIAFLEGIGDTEIFWFEEPFREEDWKNRLLKDYLLKERPGTLIADGESDTDIPLLRGLAEKKLLDVWQPDVCGYGFTKWRTLMKEISQNGWLASPHAWGNVTKTHYCAHLAAAYPHHIPCVEAVLGSIEGVDFDGYCLERGTMKIPDKPGFGMDLIWAGEITDS